MRLLVSKVQFSMELADGTRHISTLHLLRERIVLFFDFLNGLIGVLHKERLPGQQGDHDSGHASPDRPLWRASLHDD